MISFSRDKLGEDYIISDFLVTHNVNYESDRIEYEFFELISDEGPFFSSSGDTQLILDGDVINDVLKEESEFVPFGDKMLNHVER